MASIIIILLIIAVALGTMFTAIGYGMLFSLSMSHKQHIAVYLLAALGFSAVVFVAFQLPWYYSLPFWLLPIFYAAFRFPSSKFKRTALRFLAIGIGLLLVSVTSFYFIYKNIGHL